ncbi:MAG: radical SAM protein [Selenomonas ruminantium]|nr:radical SAM protein [Selenomonas ruminantium]
MDKNQLKNLCKAVPSIESIIKEYEGHEVYMCQYMGGRQVNFDGEQISICHAGSIDDKPTEVSMLCRVGLDSVEKYYESVYKLFKKMEDDNFPCRRCPFCNKVEYHFSPITYVTFLTTTYCNSSCIYCASHLGKKGHGFAYDNVMEKFNELGLFDSGAIFDYGGGEPTQSPYFEGTVDYLTNHGFDQRINTNAIDFSPAIYKALANGKAWLRISPDSATYDVFLRVKGNSNCEVVWENIGKYAKASDKVVVKCNVCNYNATQNEMDAFINRCQDAGVKKIVVDAEMQSYQRTSNAGPFYYTKAVFEMAHYLYDRAKEKGFHVQVGAYAFGCRPKYDEQRRLCLPDEYIDNTDYETIANGIYIEAYPTVEQMVSSIIQQPERQLVIFGYGGTGRIAEKACLDKGLKPKIIDNNEKLWGSKILSAQKFLKNASEKSEQLLIILANIKIRDMLKQINKSGVDVKVYWCNYAAYINYSNK